MAHLTDLHSQTYRLVHDRAITVLQRSTGRLIAHLTDIHSQTYRLVHDMAITALHLGTSRLIAHLTDIHSQTYRLAHDRATTALHLGTSRLMAHLTGWLSARAQSDGLAGVLSHRQTYPPQKAMNNIEARISYSGTAQVPE